MIMYCFLILYIDGNADLYTFSTIVYAVRVIDVYNIL